MKKKKNDIVLMPLEEGNQRRAIRSNADIVCLTGGTGGGKSFALYYAPIDYIAQNDNAKIGVIFRKGRELRRIGVRYTQNPDRCQQGKPAAGALDLLR